MPENRNTASAKRIWITGAGSGIGRALALLYASQGHQIIISGRTLEKLEHVCREASGLAGSITAVTFDVTDESSVETTRLALESHTEYLDLIIMNAGSCEYIENQTLEPALFRRVMDTNFFGMINSLNAALPLLRKAPARPHVAGICSLATFIGFPRAEAYGASKCAARYLLNCIRIDFNQLMDVTVINPGFVTTPMSAANDFPMPFEMDAESAAQRIARSLQKRPLEFNFPDRLVAGLRLTQLFQKSWYKRISRK